ncbi:MAG: hypothetical protein LBQ77_03920 [Treponema sp.]|jgi:hypothetical protein|nr:hypothetical protein [Treponema sp.]
MFKSIVKMLSIATVLGSLLTSCIFVLSEGDGSIAIENDRNTTTSLTIVIYEGYSATKGSDSILTKKETLAPYETSPSYPVSSGTYSVGINTGYEELWYDNVSVVTGVPTVLPISWFR